MLNEKNLQTQIVLVTDEGGFRVVRLIIQNKSKPIKSGIQETGKTGWY